MIASRWPWSTSGSRTQKTLPFFFFFQAEDGIRDVAVTGFRRVLFRSRMRAGLVLWLGLVAARPGAAQDRWQLTLNSGTTLWDLSLVKLAGDTLVVRHADSTYALPLAQVDEIRLVQKSTRHITPEPGRYGGQLGGADDEVHRLTLHTLPERREILQQIFKAHPPTASP